MGELCANSWVTLKVKKMVNSCTETLVIPKDDSLSCSIGIVYVVGGGHFRSGDGLIVLDNVNCNGTEPYIISCPVQGIGVHNCDPREDAGVFCPGKSEHILRSR